MVRPCLQWETHTPDSAVEYHGIARHFGMQPNPSSQRLKLAVLGAPCQCFPQRRFIILPPPPMHVHHPGTDKWVKYVRKIGLSNLELV